VSDEETLGSRADIARLHATAPLSWWQWQLDVLNAYLADHPAYERGWVKKRGLEIEIAKRREKTDA
jgi:hypothetical protein